MVIVLCPETRTSGKRVVFLEKRTKMPVGSGVVVLALATDAHSLARCASFLEKDYDHDTTIPERFRKKWDEMNAL